MRFPDVSELGAATVEGVGRFRIFMVHEDWEPDYGDHDSDHAAGGCECPCLDPISALEEAIRVSGSGSGHDGRVE